MSTGLRLGEYASTPLYNIKAVVQATGISPSTLRAWERRYNIARPQRSDSGYRLYAERDVAVIRWLKTQVDAGMSISQAVSWLGTIVEDAGAMEQAILPVSGSGAPLQNPLAQGLSSHPQQLRDFERLRQELLDALASYSEDEAESVVAEAFSMFPVEQVGEQLFLPVLREIDERREQGALSMMAEHFACNYLIQRLGALLRFIPNGLGGPSIWLVGARSKVDEVNALVLAIYLRRSGYYIFYLGQTLPTDEVTRMDFAQEAKRRHPAMVLFNVNTAQAAVELGRLTAYLTQANYGMLPIGFCGSIFNHRPELRAGINGVYLGTNAKEITQNVDKTLLDKQRHSRTRAKMDIREDIRGDIDGGA